MLPDVHRALLIKARSRSHCCCRPAAAKRGGSPRHTSSPMPASTVGARRVGGNGDDCPITCIRRTLHLRIFSTHGEGRRSHRDLRCLDAKDRAGAPGSSRKERGRIMGGEPIACPSQTLSIASPPQHVFHRLLRNRRRQERQTTIAEASPMEDHRYCRRSSAHLRPIRRQVLISPGRSTPLQAHFLHASHVIQAFVHSALACLHLAPSSGLPLRFHIPRFLSMNCGRTCALMQRKNISPSSLTYNRL
jgi:hypothetical protein